MKYAFFLLLLCISLALAEAQPFEFSTPPEAWSVSKKEGKDGIEAFSFVPKDGRHALLLISFIGKLNEKFSTPEGIRGLHKLACGAYAPKGAEIVLIEPKTAQNYLLYSSFEDPDLKGKPVKKDSYKFAVVIELVLKSGEYAHVTLLADEGEGKSLTDALALLETMVVKAKYSAAKIVGNNIVVDISGLDRVLIFPSQGIQISDFPANDSKGYFLLERADGLGMSGWLDSADKYQNFTSFWKSEKASLEKGMNLKVHQEKFHEIPGWKYVTYMIDISDTAKQCNLRACRTEGNTWVDVHLSLTGTKPTDAALVEILKSLTLTPRGAAK